MKRAFLFVAVLVPTLALAHDDAAWIMAEPGYLAASGQHCCGRTDCRRAEPGEVVEIAPGVWRAGKRGEITATFREGERGTYVSRDYSPWLCQYERAQLPPRCLFVVGGSS